MHTYHWDEASDCVLTKTALIDKLESLGYSCMGIITNQSLPEFL